MLRLSGSDRIDFENGNIHRPLVTFSNGAKSWVNRSKNEDWQVDGPTLPPRGYLVLGPDGFKQHRSLLAGKVTEVVLCRATTPCCRGRGKEAQLFERDETSYGEMPRRQAIQSRITRPPTPVRRASWPWKR